MMSGAMTDRPREVTVYAKQSVYRARVEPHTKGILRRRAGYRFLIERRWSKVPRDMVYEESWKVWEGGPWVATRDEAAAGADRWLDRAEQSNPNEQDYR